MEQKKATRFVEQLSAERNMIEGRDLKDAVAFLEEHIIGQLGMHTSARLLCLLALTQDGLAAKDYRGLVKLFLQSYGHEHIATFHCLKKLGLFYEQSIPGLTSNAAFPGKASASLLSSKVLSVLPGRSQFKTMSKRVGLIPEARESGSYDLRNPPDPGYVFGGSYIPIVCRLIEILILSADGGSDEVLKLLPGERFCLRRSRERRAVSERVVLVCFIGGATFAEISALRFLAKQRRFKVLVAATSVVNGNQLITQTVQ